MARSFLVRCALLAAALAVPAPRTGHAAEPAAPVLSVCADPDNLPYSNAQRAGFENKIAEVLAADLHADLRYFWFAEHRSFFRRTLLDGLCDVVISVPAALPIVATTRPYFTSSYVAVTRSADSRRFESFDDAWLSDANIGLQLVGREGATTPPAVSLSHRGTNQRITGFPMWSDETDPSPQGRIVDAVADGGIDVAFVWGPFGGYFAKAHGDALRVQPIVADPGMPDLAFVFPMAMGVRKADTALRDRLQAAIDRHQPEIDAILSDYAIPLVAGNAPSAITASVPPLTH